MGRIHSIAVAGFHRRHPDGTWDFTDWRSVTDSTLHDRGAEKDWILKAGFTEQEFVHMMRLIERYREELDCPQPVLCHGDFLPEHIFVDDELHITGVLDFGLYCGDHPIHDFAVLSMANSELRVEEVLRGYPECAFLSDRFEAHLYLHRLTLDMGYLAHHMRIEHYPEIEANRRGLRNTLQELSKMGL